jgi:hypothetical protein
MISFLTSFFAGAVGAVVTLILAPWTQHFFWTLARRAELRFAAIAEMNTLWAKFLDHAILREQGQQTSLPEDFFCKLDAASTQIRALFSAESLNAFEHVHSMIGHGLKPDVPIHDFAAARQNALSDLYQAMGITERSFLRRLYSLVR